MALFSPQADVSVVPQAPNINPQNFANTGLANMVPEISQGLQLGQALARLPQLQSQLDLEKAQRKAEMSQTQLKQAWADHLQDNFPQYAVVADQANQAAGAAAALAGQNSNNALTTARVAAAGGAPQAAGNTEVIQANTALTGAINSQWFNSLPPASQDVIKANAGAIGQTYGNLGTTVPSGVLGELSATPISPAASALQAIPATLGGANAGEAPAAPLGDTTAAPEAPASGLNNLQATLQAVRQAKWLDATTDVHVVPIVDPKTGNTIDTQVRTDKATGQVISSTPLGVTKPADLQRPVVMAARDVTNLAQTQAASVNLQQAFDEFNKAYPANSGILKQIGRMSEAAKAEAIASPVPEQGGLFTKEMSVLEKGITGMKAAPETQKLLLTLQNYRATIGKLDPETAKGTNNIAPDIGDLANPELFASKIKGSQAYVDGRLQVYRDRGVAAAVDPALATESSTAVPAASAVPDNTQTVPQGSAIGQTQSFVIGGKSIPFRWQVGSKGVPTWVQVQ